MSTETIVEVEETLSGRFVQRERLLEIADRCPVHRTLTSEVKIRSRLGAAEA